MMYCKNCGKEMEENSAVCPHCGSPVAYIAPRQDVNGKKFNVFSLLGIIFALVGVVNGIASMIVNANATLAISFFVFIISGLVLSIIGTVKSKKYRTGKVTGIFGIVISALALFLYVGFFLLIVIIFTGIGQRF